MDCTTKYDGVEIPMPDVLQDRLPEGTRTAAVDGKLIYSHTSGNGKEHAFYIEQHPEAPSLSRIIWGGNDVKLTYYEPAEGFLAVQEAHGHICTVFFFVVPVKRRLRLIQNISPFAVYSHTMREWLLVLDPNAMDLIFMKQSTIRLLFGKNNRPMEGQHAVNTVRQIVQHLNNRLAGHSGGSGRLK